MIGVLLKKQKKHEYIEVYCGPNREKHTFKRGEIPIKEEVIIGCSKMFFNDPEPCYIHRGAVCMRLNEEIMAYMKQYEAREQVMIEGQGNLLVEAIDLEEIYAVKWFVR